MQRLARLRDHPLTQALAAERGEVGAWLVGGAVRDALLGRPGIDLDAVVERDIEPIARRVADRLSARIVRLGGDRFSALRLVASIGVLDLWEADAGSLDEDLERRDFTINAIAVAVADGALVDPHGGCADLRDRRLRATRVTVFAEDPVRVLRLARFEATLDGFRVDPATQELARASASRLREAAGERLRTELSRLFIDATYSRALGALDRAGIWPLLWSLPGASSNPGAIDWQAAAERLDARLPSLDEAASDPEQAPHRVVLGHAVALACAEPEPSRAEAALEGLAARVVASRKEAQAIRSHLALAREPPPVETGELAWWVYRAGGRHAAVAALAAALAEPSVRAAWDRARAESEELVGRRGRTLLTPRPLLSGDEIGRLLGLEPGPRIGEATRRLLQAQVRGEVTTRDEAVALLRLGEGGQALPEPTSR